MNTSHYPSLELCKKLTEVGFPEPTEKYYVRSGIVDKEWMRENGPCDCAVCPSVMELLDEICKIHFPIINQDRNGKIRASIFIEGKKAHMWFDKNTLPNALAEMYLWLKEHNYLP